jgi:hypothetical protein
VSAVDEPELPATARAAVVLVVDETGVVDEIVAVAGVEVIVAAVPFDDAPTPLATAIVAPTAAKPAMLAAPTARRARRAGCGRRRCSVMPGSWRYELGARCELPAERPGERVGVIERTPPVVGSRDDRQITRDRW